eukprot:Blabericola_migrator_1__9982@NODE_5522_length_741_cov_199_959941_g3580_i0_p1_GENE_NODE_5522_length_741_cov_199_959941_g3580_i0NODE_5522_length_741_cov_199_959941_g3580_i0_p1_ORF_typecomplete_len197_score36_55Proteasome/PF00227_26/4_8e33AbiEi_4/PF13338_6/12AbiEi_4/PF13338_6/62_NODE_5522_length_741_cov_199_959941_g3580_i0115705
MDTVIGIVGKDFIAVAADQHAAYSILSLQNTEDKIYEIDGNKLLATAGVHADRASLGEYIQKNLHLTRLVRQGVALSPKAAANYTRTELAEALRKGPYQVDVVLAGMNKETSAPEMYRIDWFGTLSEARIAAHGYGSHFVLGLLDREYREDMSREDVMRLLNLCFQELKTRFVLSQSSFLIKICDKSGIQASTVKV